MKTIVLTIAILFYIPYYNLLGQNSSLTEAEAIRLAEQFIIQNGYTNLPADKSKVQFELYDRFVDYNIDSVIKKRHNSLHSKAFCISEESDSWHVGFLSKRINIDSLDSYQKQSNLRGRVIIVDKNGAKIKIAHKQPLFSMFKKLNQ